MPEVAAPHWIETLAIAVGAVVGVVVYAFERFQTKDAAKETRDAMEKRIDDVQEAAKDSKAEMVQWLGRVEDKLDRAIEKRGD